MFSRAIKPSLAAARAVRFNSSVAAVENAAAVNKITSATTTGKQLTSGAPAELTAADNRVVKIYKEAKYATQSSHTNGEFWKLEFDIVGKGNRWENDIIGYQSTSDYMQATRLDFNSKEDAIRFAEGQGWNYYVKEPKVRREKPKSYSDNFLWVPGQLKYIWTK